MQPAYSETWPLRLNLNYVEDHIHNRALWAADARAPLPAKSARRRKIRAQTGKALSRRVRASLSRARRPDAFCAAIGAGEAQDGQGHVTLKLQGSPDTAQMYVIVPKSGRAFRLHDQRQAFRRTAGMGASAIR